MHKNLSAINAHSIRRIGGMKPSKTPDSRSKFMKFIPSPELPVQSTPDRRNRVLTLQRDRDRLAALAYGYYQQKVAKVVLDDETLLCLRAWGYLVENNFRPMANSLPQHDGGIEG